MKNRLLICCLLPIFSLFGNKLTVQLDSLQHLLNSNVEAAHKTEIYAQIGQIYIETNNHTQALDYLLKALNRCTQPKQDSLKIVCYQQVGRIFFYQKNYPKCDYYNQLALKLAKNNPMLIGDFFKRKGDAFLTQFAYDSALVYYNKAEKMYNLSLHKDSLRYASLFANLSIIFYEDKLKSIDYAFKAKAYFGNNRESKYYINQGNIGNFYKEMVLNNLFDSLSKISKYVPASRNRCIQQGYFYTLDAIQLAKDAGNRTDEAYYTGILSEIQEVDGNYKAALFNFKKYYELMDSVFSQDIKNELAEKESKLEIEKKNQEIKLKQVQLSTQKKLGFALIISILFLSIIGLLLYFIAKNRKNHNAILNKLNRELTESNEVKSKLFGILSHDLRSPIANLITLLNLKKINSFNNEQEEQLYTDNVIISAEQLLENMETLLLWSKSQMHTFKPNCQPIQIATLFKYIELFFKHEKQVSFHFENPENIEIISDELFLNVIMQNLTSNAIKAVKTVEEPKVIWSASKKMDGIEISIKDNGKGMDAATLKDILTTDTSFIQKNGFGLQIITELIKFIKGNIKFETNPNQGFTAIIFIPIVVLNQ